MHKRVKRPWGYYTVLNTGAGFKVKLVEVGLSDIVDDLERRGLVV